MAGFQLTKRTRKTSQHDVARKETLSGSPGSTLHGGSAHREKRYEGQDNKLLVRADLMIQVQKVITSRRLKQKARPRFSA